MDFRKLFHWKRSSPRVAAVFDIGSGSVAVAVVALAQKEGAPSRIIAAQRRMLSSVSRDEGQRVAALTTLAGEVGKSVLDSYAKSPKSQAISEVSAIFHVPYASARTGFAMRQFANPTKITARVIRQLAEEALGKEGVSDGLVRAERSVLRILLNGYMTKAPEEKEARTLEVTAFESAVHAECHQAVLGAIQALLPGRDICTRTAVMAMASAVHELSLAESYTILDITSEASGCVSISPNGIRSVGVVPVGTRTVIETASAGQNTSAEEMKSLLRMIAEGTCSGTTCAHVERLLGKAEGQFVKPFGEVFAKMAEEDRLPNQLLLLVPHDIADWAQGFFERIDFGQFTVTGKPFRATVLSADALDSLVVASAGVHHDAALTVAAALVHIRS